MLGFWPEKVLLSLITFWLIGVLLTASRGKTRILGFVAMTIAVCVEAYVYFGLLFLGTNPFLETQVVKLPYLLPFACSSSRAVRDSPRRFLSGLATCAVGSRRSSKAFPKQH